MLKFQPVADRVNVTAAKVGLRAASHQQAGIMEAFFFGRGGNGRRGAATRTSPSEPAYAELPSSSTHGGGSQQQLERRPSHITPRHSPPTRNHDTEVDGSNPRSTSYGVGGGGPVAMDPRKHGSDIDVESQRHVAKAPAQQDATGGETLRVVGLIVAYYVANSFVVMTNKLLMSSMDFRFPMLLTALHMVSSVCLSYVFIDVFGFFEKQALASHTQRRKVGALALMFAGSVLCGNAALQFVSVSFSQIVGASTPFFVCLFGYLLFQHAQPLRVYVSLAPIVFGTALSTYGEVSLSFVGFCLTLGATMLRGTKTVWQAHLLSNEERITSPNLLRFMSRDAALVLLACSLVFEGARFRAWLGGERTATSAGGGAGVLEGGRAFPAWQFTFLLIVNPLGAYLSNMAQFVLTKHVGALTLQVIGNAKGPIVVLTSLAVFGNAITAAAAMGYATTLAGVAWYSAEKRRSTAQTTHR